jgi:putative NADPH-quinone reductase
MAPKIYVVCGHPVKESFNCALATAYSDAALAAGADVRRVHLADLQFDPVLHHAYLKIQTLEPDLLKCQDDIRWATKLVLFYPIWWGSVPALMKGWIDRVFHPRFAFHYPAGAMFPDRLLTGRSGRLVVTMDNPPWWYALRYGSPDRKMMKAMMLEFCGISPVRHVAIGSVKLSTLAKRLRWLDDLRAIGRRDAARA